MGCLQDHQLDHILVNINTVKPVYNGHFQDQLGDNCIQNFHLGRYMVGYTVGNLVLRRRVSGAVT